MEQELQRIMHAAEVRWYMDHFSEVLGQFSEENNRHRASEILKRFSEKNEDNFKTRMARKLNWFTKAVDLTHTEDKTASTTDDNLEYHRHIEECLQPVIHHDAVDDVPIVAETPEFDPNAHQPMQFGWGVHHLEPTPTEDVIAQLCEQLYSAVPGHSSTFYNWCEETCIQSHAQAAAQAQAQACTLGHRAELFDQFSMLLFCMSVSLLVVGRVLKRMFPSDAWAAREKAERRRRRRDRARLAINTDILSQETEQERQEATKELLEVVAEVDIKEELPIEMLLDDWSPKAVAHYLSCQVSTDNLRKMIKGVKEKWNGCVTDVGVGLGLLHAEGWEAGGEQEDVAVAEEVQAGAKEQEATKEKGVTKEQGLTKEQGVTKEQGLTKEQGVTKEQEDDKAWEIVPAEKETTISVTLTEAEWNMVTEARKNGKGNKETSSFRRAVTDGPQMGVVALGGVLIMLGVLVQHVISQVMDL